MRALAVDHGAARIGLAISDELGMFARPLTVVQNSQDAAAQIAAIARTESVGTIVVPKIPKAIGNQILKLKICCKK